MVDNAEKVNVKIQEKKNNQIWADNSSALNVYHEGVS